MSNFLDAVTGAAGSATCQLLGVPQYVDDMIQRVGFPLYNNPLVAIPNFWRNALCDTDAPPPNPPAFTGGQCPVKYNIAVAFRRDTPGTGCPTTVDNRSLTGYWGPIGSPRIVNGTAPSNRISNTITFRTRGNGGAPNAGEDTSLSFGSSNPDCPPGVIQSFTVTRQDGQPDNCGNPPPFYPPLRPPDVTIPRSVPYENSSGVTVTVPIIFVFARATIDATANITIPFTANINGTLNVSGTVNLNGEVNINIGTAGNPPVPKDPRKDPCDDIAIPDGEVPEDPTDADQPNRPDREREEVITGVLVTVTSLSNERASTIVQGDNPDIYAPSLGFVQFLCRVGETAGGWTSDQPVKNRRNLIPCPWGDGAVAVRGTPQPGVTWTLTPVFGYAGVPVQYVQ